MNGQDESQQEARSDSVVPSSDPGKALGAFMSSVFFSQGGSWSEQDQARLNSFFRHWLEMLKAEMAEKEQTIIEIAQRLDMQDEKISTRVESDEFQGLLRKGFRDWAGAESEVKRTYVRNILTNAAAADLVSDDVVRLFIDWLKTYSEFHFSVIAVIYNSAGSTRATVWEELGRQAVRENSAEADLFKLLFRDLSTGSIIRQHRETDYNGNFINKPPVRRATKQSSYPKVAKSAFDDAESYELTELGQQFVHYAMTDVPVKITYSNTSTTKERAD